MNRRKIFYQNDDVHNLIESEGDSTLLRAGSSVFAQSDSRCASSSTLLLGSDQQASPIFQADDDRPSAAVYTPYGVEEASRSWIGFTGAARDDVLMGYLLGNGYRLYNPILMRFCSPDSFSPFMMINSYAYCEGDPVNSSDPSGHMPNPNRARSKTPPNTIGLSQGEKDFWSLVNPQVGRILPRDTSGNFQNYALSVATSRIPDPPTQSPPAMPIIPVSSPVASVSLTTPRPENPISPSIASGSVANPSITRGQEWYQVSFKKMTAHERDSLLQISEDRYRSENDPKKKQLRDRAIQLNYEANLKGAPRKSGFYEGFSYEDKRYVITWISRNRTTTRKNPIEPWLP